MPSILGANEIKATGYDVANSVRFDDGDNARISKTFSSAGNSDTWTMSVWVKRSTLGANSSIFTCNGLGAGAQKGTLRFDSSDKISAYVLYAGSAWHYITSEAVYRDVSAWYHVVVRCDTTQGTDTDRLRLYVNGTLQTLSASTYPDQNEDTFFNEAEEHQVASLIDETEDFDGYMAEFCWIDGSSLAPTSFGEFDSDSPNIWKPIDVSGLTFGTNGVYLDFEDSSDLGTDASGNSDWTATNLAATDQCTDTCTNNFATLNPLVNFNSGVFSEGNCAITYGDDTISTIGVTKGRWYWEAQRTNTATEAHFGIGLSKGFYSATSIVSDGDRLYTRSGATYFSAVSNLSILTFGSNSGTSAAVGNGDVISFYLDLESSTKNITIKKNDGATPIVNVDLTYSGAEPIFAFCRMNSGCSSSWNFGNPIAALSSANSDPNGYGSFEYSTTLNSVDYYALCTKNLAEYG